MLSRHLGGFVGKHSVRKLKGTLQKEPSKTTPKGALEGTPTLVAE